MLIVYAVVGLAAAIWLLILSAILGWPGFLGMLLLLVGIGISIVNTTNVIVDRTLPPRPTAGMVGVLLLFLGAIGLVWGLVATVF